MTSSFTSTEMINTVHIAEKKTQQIIFLLRNSDLICFDFTTDDFVTAASQKSLYVETILFRKKDKNIFLLHSHIFS